MATCAGAGAGWSSRERSAAGMAPRPDGEWGPGRVRSVTLRAPTVTNVRPTARGRGPFGSGRGVSGSGRDGPREAAGAPEQRGCLLAQFLGDPRAGGGEPVQGEPGAVPGAFEQVLQVLRRDVPGRV